MELLIHLFREQLAKFHQKPRLQFVNRLAKCPLQQLKGMIPGTVSGEDRGDAGRTDSIGAGEDFLVGLVIKVETADQGPYIFIRECCGDLADNVVGTAVGAANEHLPAAMSAPRGSWTNISIYDILGGKSVLIHGESLSEFFHA